MKKVCICLVTLLLKMHALFSQSQSNLCLQFAGMEWSTKHLTVDTFLNGDPIPFAKSPEEWNRYAINNLPAWSYVNDNPEKGEYGKLYNWYAVNDPRGLPMPKGYRIPTAVDWSYLIHYMAYLKEISFCESHEFFFSKLDSSNKLILAPVFNDYLNCARMADGSFDLYEGIHNGWWCTNGYSMSEAWYCSSAQSFWRVIEINNDVKRKGWGYRIITVKYLEK